MDESTGRSKAARVTDMFERIARNYDLMNRLMTAGQDVTWRRRVIELANPHPGDRFLDIGTGTGDLTREALRQQPQAQVVAADFTLGMMFAGRKSGDLPFVAADALHLPFADDSMDVTVSGFLFRNVSDIHLAVREQYRVLKNGGRMVSLDTTRPKKNLFSPFIWLHMHVVIPLLGRLLSGTSDAYRYLPESTEHFLFAEQLAQVLSGESFKDVHFERRMFGTIAIHWGKK